VSIASLAVRATAAGIEIALIAPAGVIRFVTPEEV
jgi:hypothetical protein